MASRWPHTGAFQRPRKTHLRVLIKVRMKYLENFFKCMLTSSSHNVETFSLSAVFQAPKFMEYWRTHTNTSLHMARSSDKQRAAPKVGQEFGGHGNAFHSACQTSGEYPSPRPRLASLPKVLHLLVRGSTRARCRTHVADNATQQSKCRKDCNLDSARLLAWTVRTRKHLAMHFLKLKKRTGQMQTAFSN